MNKTIKLSGKFASPFVGEVRDLLEMLVKAGFSFDLMRFDNGDGPMKCASYASAVEHLTACDCATIFLSEGSATRRLAAFIVLGNSPGELVADYTIHPVLESVIDAHSKKWEGGS